MASNHLILGCKNTEPLSSSSPPAFNLSQDQGFFQWVSSLHQVTKVLSFSFSISPSNEYSGLISFRIDGLFSLQSKGLSRVFSNTTVQKHRFFSTQFSLWCNSHIHLYMTTGKTIALTRLTFVNKVRETNITLSSNFPPLKKLYISNLGGNPLWFRG